MQKIDGHSGFAFAYYKFTRIDRRLSGLRFTADNALFYCLLQYRARR